MSKHGSTSILTTALFVLSHLKIRNSFALLNDLVTLPYTITISFKLFSSANCSWALKSPLLSGADNFQFFFISKPTK